jgi:hypothetical protein
MVNQENNLNELYGALVKTQSEMESAKLNSKNPHYKSQYANLESCIEASRPYLTKNGLCVIQRIMTEGDKTWLMTRLAHISGQYIESHMDIKPAKNDMQGLGASITYARRYAYSSLICLSTGDDDDGEKDRKLREEESKKKPVQPETLTMAQIGELEKYFGQDETLLPLLLKKVSIATDSEILVVEDIPRQFYKASLDYLKEQIQVTQQP